MFLKTKNRDKYNNNGYAKYKDIDVKPVNRIPGLCIQDHFSTVRPLICDKLLI